MSKFCISLLAVFILAIVASVPGVAYQLDDPTEDSPDWRDWGCGYSGVADIACAFNNARDWEEGNLGIALPELTMPSQAEWDQMSDGEKALWLINEERTARGVAPLHGVEENVTAVAQDYADLMLAQDCFGHYCDGQSPWARLEDNPTIEVCRDLLSVAENISVLATSESSINLPVERSIYSWTYTDKDSLWGHRQAILWYPYNDNGGTPGMEGFLGIGRANGGPYQGPFSQAWNFAELIVMNVFDPCSDWDYEPPPPEAVTGSVHGLIHDSDDPGTVKADFSGTINPLGTATEGFFEYWRLSDPGMVMTTEPQDIGQGHAPVSLVTSVQGLVDDTAYAFRIVADSGTEMVWGESVEFNTQLSYTDPMDDSDHCGGFSPCWEPHIQDAVEAGDPGTTIRVRWGEYLEDSTVCSYGNLNLFQNITLHLGLDETYNAPAVFPAVIRPGSPGEPTLTIENGTVIAWHVVLE